jgi:toxin FitB
MRYLLDTNIISNIAKPIPSASLLAWMSQQVDGDLFIASLTVAEICRGVLEKPAGKRRDLLEAWFDGPEGPQALFAGRVLPFDAAAGLIWARLMAEGKARGRPRSALDMIIAAVAEANGCVVVTDNERDFDRIGPSTRCGAGMKAPSGYISAKRTGPAGKARYAPGRTAFRNAPSNMQPRRLVPGPRDVLRIPAAIHVNPLRRQLQHPVGQRGQEMPIVRNKQHRSLELR